MSIIRTQAEAQRCRSQLHICYLCGEDLDNREPASREHIIPSAVLGRGPHAETWSPLLDVHQSCECNQKRPLDEVYALFQRMESPMEPADEAMGRLLGLAAQPATDNARRSQYAAGARLAADAACAACAPDAEGGLLAQQAIARYIDTLDAPKKIKANVKNAYALLFNPQQALNCGHYRKTALKPADDIVTDGLNAPIGSFALDGIRAIKAAEWNWVRGFHALIYATCLPNAAPHDEATPALQVFIGTISPRRAYNECFYNTIQDHLDAAAIVNKADGIKYWDQSSGFLCAWVRAPGTEPFYHCLWRIDVPGPQETKVWYGWYASSVLPRTAKALLSSDYAWRHEKPN